MVKDGRISFDWAAYSNDYLNEPDLSFRLEPTWPGCIEDEVSEMKFVLETGIPVPKKHERNGIGQELSEAMKEMKPGQSFFVPIDPSRSVAAIQTSIAIAKRYLNGECKDWSFASRKVKTEPQGVRIWRLE